MALIFYYLWLIWQIQSMIPQHLTNTTFSSKKVTELLADEKDPIFNAWLIDNAAYLQILLDDAPTNPSTKFLNGYVNGLMLLLSVVAVIKHHCI